MKMVGDAKEMSDTTGGRRGNDIVILGIAVWEMILNKKALINKEVRLIHILCIISAAFVSL